MALFPEYPGPITDREQDIKSFIEKFYTDSYTVNAAFWSEAWKDTQFEAGDQALWNDLYANIPSSRRSTFNFNRIRRVVSNISGYQRRNRKSTIITPRENGDELTADQFTKLIMWNNNTENVLETISEGFHGALVTGLNLLHVWMDYRQDPISGDIKVDHVPYNAYMIDPFFRKADLSDCNGIWKRTYLTKQECASLLPDATDEIMSLSGKPGGDGKFQMMPENYMMSGKSLLTYDEFWYRDYREQKLLIDTQTGETMEWTVDDPEKLEQFLSVYPQVIMQETHVPTTRLAILVQGHVMHDGPNPYGIDEYPFVPVFGHFNPQMQDYTYRIQGVVRNLRDSQYLYNRQKIIQLDILESQINSGWVAKEGSLVNPKDAFFSGQGKVLWRKAESQPQDVERIQPAQIPPSQMEMAKSLADEINQISGVNEELLGSALDDKAGVLSMLRQGAGLTTLQELFDNLDRSQRLLGRLQLKLMQANFTPGKVKRIIEEEPSPQFYHKAFGKYDAVPEDGLNTSTQRQMQFAQLLQLKEVGVPVPDDVLLESATVQNKKELTQAIQQANEQQQQQQQMQLQAQIQEQQARTELAQARSLADRGLFAERTSRVQENVALADERRAEAVKDRYAGVLDLVKSMKELQSMDLQDLEKVISLNEMLKAQETQLRAGDQQQLQQDAQLATQESPGEPQGPLNSIQ
jgi:hypothetical protein